MTGQKIGMITVLERDYTYAKEHGLSSNHAYWKCKCDCGNILTMLGTNLRRRPNSSCGCIAKSKMKAPSDLTGMRFGNLTVLCKDLNYTVSGRKRVAWKCQCDCGKIKTILRDSLIGGKTHSCGCMKNFLNQSHLEGQRFGHLLVIEDTGKRKDENVIWKCQCDCGNVIEVRTNCLTSGRQKSCGCISSKGEEKIIKILNDNNILFETQKSFDNCLNPETKFKLRFDFYVDNNFLLEYDGAQHFSSGGGWNTEQHFIQT